MLELLSKNKFLVLIFLFALTLRIYKLSEFPHGFHADEVRVGWNAFSILKTGADDRGNKFALYYNTFGDYRPTGIFYLTIPSIALFEKSEFAVRFPSALLGALTILPLYLFTNLLVKDKNFENWKLKIGHFASFMLAVSPWHISVSRGTSEVIISLFLSLWGLFFLLIGINQKRTINFLLSLVFLVTSYFFYHSIRILAPIFVFITTIYFWKEIKQINLKKYVLSVFLLLSLATALLSLNKEARGRFSQVSIFNDLDVQYELSKMPFEEGPNKIFIARAFHNKVSTYTRRFTNEYANYFSANFFLNGTTAKPARYQTVGVGLLTYIELGLLIVGLIAIAQKKFSVLPLLLLFTSPIAGALTTEDAPNMHRSLYMIPFISAIGAYGFSLLSTYSRRLSWITILGLVLNTVFYLHMYYVHNKVHFPLYRNVGAKELALYLNEVQDNYDKIILTNIPDDPYPWIAYFTGRDPAVFNKDAVSREEGTWTTENFVFTGIRCPSRDAFKQPDVKRLLVVDAEGCATESNLKNRSDVEIVNVVKRPDESEVYTLWRLK